MTGLCNKCGKSLTGNQQRWCSEECQRLGLKAEYRKRNLERFAEYNRTYRANKKRTK